MIFLIFGKELLDYTHYTLYVYITCIYFEIFS